MIPHDDKLEIERLRALLRDQNRRLEAQGAALHEWNRLFARRKIDTSDPAAVQCFFNEVSSAAKQYAGMTGESVGIEF